MPDSGLWEVPGRGQASQRAEAATVHTGIPETSEHVHNKADHIANSLKGGVEEEEDTEAG